MKTLILILGCVVLALLLAENRILIREVLEGRANSALPLLVVLLVFMGMLVSLTSHATATGILGLSVVVQVLKHLEQGSLAEVPTLIILGAMAGLFVASVLALRAESKSGGD